MQVFLVPVGSSRYQLYVELADHESGQGPPASEPPKGWFGRTMQRFRGMLAEAEDDRRRRERGEASQATGLWRTILGKVVEAVAEQRLLWGLRHQTAVVLRHPADLDTTRALDEVRQEFTRDATKHVRWMIIDGLVAAVTGPVLFLVPGPNIVAYYFTFRTVGHFLSWRGALKGRNVIQWRAEPCAELSDVRQALRLSAVDRRNRLEAISAALGLKHLAGFVERVSS